MSSPFTSGKPKVWNSDRDLPSDIPRSCGAYRFVNKSDSEVVYIGITGNLYNRMSAHRCSKKSVYDPSQHNLHYQTCRPNSRTWDDLRKWEVEKIQQHDPRFNRCKGGNGKVPLKLYYDGTVIDVGNKESVSDAMHRQGFWPKLASIFGYRP